VEKERLDGDDVFVLRDFLTPHECREFIARSEQLGYEEAPLTTAAGAVVNKRVRDNVRVMVDDPALADALFRRARPFLPGCVGRWEVAGFNERWRYYRYDPGERFAPHDDGSFARGEDEKSRLTFMVYLNDDFEGGATNFYYQAGAPYLTVRPVCGDALVFVHWKLHEGARVGRGRKYVLRTDVMCRRVAAG
jgi:predicted 2-oxoglutarate/Fe(II)-dependent dioxygenase YbiX